MLKFNFYHNRKDNFYSNKVERETTGLIGYIRGDFGSGGNSFHHSWFENKGKLNNEVFKEDLNKVMEFLRERMLTDRMYMRSVVYGNPNAKIDSKESTSYGVFVETDGYEYDIRAICDDGNYDFYIYCYDKRFQEPQFLNSRRFRDEHGKLNEPVEEIAKKTLPEARNYYVNGDKYENNGKMYTFKVTEENMYFEGKDGEKLFVAPELMETFLPDVATEGNSFVKVPLSQTLSNLTLGDLIQSVKLSSVHLVHDEAEIDLATVEDLSDSMLTSEGRKAWSDVLNAKVTEIYNGYYGIQIECSGVDEQRLADFSQALAGNWSAEECDEWFDYETTEGPNMSM